jgi:hypothetical protein
MAGKTPLVADFDSIQTTILEHPVDGNPVNLEQFLQLFGGQQIVHDVTPLLCFVTHCYNNL